MKLTSLPVIARVFFPKQSPLTTRGLLACPGGRCQGRRGERPPRNTCTWRKCRCDEFIRICTVGNFVLRFTLLTFLLTACSALERPTLGTATPLPPTPTPFLSPTVVWFPPTETPTPSALTVFTATPDFLPGLGKVLYTDDFTDPKNWSDLGTDTVRDGRLTLAASDGTYLMSLHQDLLVSDFYAEIKVQLSLCRGADEYGLLVRAVPTSYYRFTVNCNGEIKADRITNGGRVPLKLPYVTMDSPRGGPAEVTLAVWAVGREMRFFLNGHYQFSADDPVFPTGSLGVFVRAAADSPVTVSFSDLVVRAVDANP